MQIEITLKQLKKFVDNLKTPDKSTRLFLMGVERVLEESLIDNVFNKPHSDTLLIESKKELQGLIKTGKSHRPAPARAGAQYSEIYLKRKREAGESMPHKFWQYTFWHGTKVDRYPQQIIMTVTPPAGAERLATDADFKDGSPNYLVYHERHRSVVKRAFLDAWGDIIKTMVKNIAKELQK